MRKIQDPALIDSIDDAQLLTQSIKAICCAVVDSGGNLNEELSAALFWGIGYLAQEAYDKLGDDQ
jgi:hypothetical protein